TSSDVISDSSFSDDSAKIKHTQSYPHSQLRYEFVTQNIGFEDLTFNLFVAGELEIISNPTTSAKEKTGRLSLLKRIMYLNAHFTFQNLKAFYAAVLREIELGEKNWGDDFHYLETCILNKPYPSSDKPGQGSNPRVKSWKFSDSTVADEERSASNVWFCTFFKKKMYAQGYPLFVCKVLKPTEYRSEIADLVRTHELVKRSGKFNFEGCRIKINDKINTDYLRCLFANFEYKDTAVCDLLEFGFPIGFVGNEDCFQKCKEAWQYKTYKGAEEFPVQINAYLRKELEFKAIIGPFKSNPFSSNLLISPLNSVPKHMSGERRVILDLSSHSGGSVNDFVPKDVYLGESVTLMFPKIDDFVKLVLAKGAERPEMAQFAYNTLGTLLLKCGIEESHKKSFPPSDIMSFL
ncbi:hypothetical protein MAR_013020, partial [Mya arenaria]